MPSVVVVCLARLLNGRLVSPCPPVIRRSHSPLAVYVAGLRKAGLPEERGPCYAAFAASFVEEWPGYGRTAAEMSVLPKSSPLNSSAVRWFFAIA